LPCSVPANQLFSNFTLPEAGFMSDHFAVYILFLIVLGYVVVAIDDLVFDVIYWIESGRMRHLNPILEEAELAGEPEARIAILTAAWHEHDVIGHMLHFNEGLIEYDNYEIFVGTYPNDLPTQLDVDRASESLSRVHKVVNPLPGPSTKADNLNAILNAVRRREAELGAPFDLVMLHDPEDVIHPLELRVVNWHFATRATLDMIQLPIYPLPVAAHAFTAGTYLDEFAELHTKDILVREWIGGFVPSAGVATTWRRTVLDRLAATSPDGRAFSVNSLTEDYDIGLKIRLDGMTSSFVRQFVRRSPGAAAEHAIRPTRIDGIRRSTRADEHTELVATRANFPHTFQTSVRQRTRWTLGIVFQSWRNWGWVGDLRTRYLLLHDRKGPVSYAIMLAGYVFALYLIGHFVVRKAMHPEWNTVLPNTSAVGVAITIGTLLMIHRLLERAIATTRIYGIRQGLLAIPRQPWSNFINLVATFRAARQFVRAERAGTAVAWDKTEHYVPGVVTR
jgi:adsorption protein B